MNDGDFIFVIIVAVMVCFGCFLIGKGIGDDYWHQPCGKYSVEAYKYKEVPARCVKK